LLKHPVMLLRILGIVFPIFIIVLIGYLYGRRHNPEMTVANTLNMEIFLPALIFSALAGKSFNLAANLPITLGALPVILGSGVLAWPLARLFGFDPKTLLPPVMFNNSGNMGIPLLLLTFGDQALGAAVIFLLVGTLLQFLIIPWLVNGRLQLGTLWREPFVVAESDQTVFWPLQPGAHRIAPDVIPFLTVALPRTKLAIKEVFLPNRPFRRRRPMTRGLRAPICHPLFERRRRENSRGAKQMQVVRHQDVTAYHPVICRLPSVEDHPGAKRVCQ